MRFAIGVGSNRGDRAAHLETAADRLSCDGRVGMVARSAAYENPAVGGPPGQPAFLNAAWVVDTALGPHQLLKRLRAVEDGLGRVRSLRHGPRTIDLDLLLAEDGRCCRNPVLELPHPRMVERAFVLEPLAEVAPRWLHPTLGVTVESLLWRLNRDR